MIKNLFGPGALVASNSLTCYVLELLRQNQGSGLSGAALLALGNLTAFFFGILLLRDKNEFFSIRRVEAIFLILWSLSSSLSYTLFFFFPESVTLPQIIVCQSLAPALAMFTSGDHRHAKSSMYEKLLGLTPIVLLLGIGYLKTNSTAPTVSDVIKYTVLGSILFSFIISQTSARIVARTRSSHWMQPRITLLNSIVLFTAVLIAGKPVIPDVISLNFSLFAGFVGALIFAIQQFYVRGLQRTEPILSALALSTSVPIAVATDAISTNQMPDAMVSLLALLYMGSVCMRAAGLNGTGQFSGFHPSKVSITDIRK